MTDEENLKYNTS